MPTEDDIPSFLAAIAVGAEPVPDAVVRNGAAAFGDIDLDTYRRSAFGWEIVEE